MAGAAVQNKDGREAPGELTLLRRACFRGAGIVPYSEMSQGPARQGLAAAGCRRIVPLGVASTGWVMIAVDSRHIRSKNNHDHGRGVTGR